MNKKTYLYVCGGLGNQLFQYAFAKNLSLRNQSPLILDTKSGFLADFRWKNQFILKEFNIKPYQLKKNILIFLFYRIYKIFFKKKIFTKIFGKSIIDETHLKKFNNKILNFKCKSSVYLMGFFQSEKYFLENKNIILKDLTPKKKIRKKNFILIKNKMVTTNSVAIGCRAYENLSKKIVNQMGGVTSIDFYKEAIIKILRQIKNPTFFLFSTLSSNLISISNFLDKKKKSFHIITDDKGFNGAVNNLQLLSHCKHHIISNSSFYWWGAYLSQNNYKKQIIFSSKNFINRDSYPSHWKII